jgi:hypothetical protein
MREYVELTCPVCRQSVEVTKTAWAWCTGCPGNPAMVTTTLLRCPKCLDSARLFAMSEAKCQNCGAEMEPVKP